MPSRRSAQPIRSGATSTAGRAKKSRASSSRSATPLERFACLLELLADGDRRGSPGRDLRLQPGVLGQHLVVLVAEQLAEPGELLAADLRQRDPALERVADEPADDAVGLP